jgi:transposase-like protein
MEVEVVAKGVRRRFTADYKLKVLRRRSVQAAGEIGGLLRREGYWSNLAKWRKQRERGELAGLTGKKRGPMASMNDGGRKPKNPAVDTFEEQGAFRIQGCEIAGGISIPTS